jgi:hypothetical protein
MPMFLDTEGYADIAIAICDRCRMKRPHATLGPDINFPGLMVCEENCRDEKDPYRLPARQTERINLRFPRPDVSVAAIQDNLVTNDQQNVIVSTEGNTNIVENDGNLDGIAISP